MKPTWPFQPHASPGLSDWIPVGSVMAFAGELAANSKMTQGKTHVESWGWTLCDGRELEVGTYPELFATLGFRYGGNGQDRFKLPDYRGYFLRGVDGGAGVDPDLADRTLPEGGDGASDEVGSLQEDALQTHEHQYDQAPAPATPSNSGTAAGAGPGQPALTKQGPTDSLAPPGQVRVSQNETRAKNVFVHFIIKFTNTVRGF